MAEQVEKGSHFTRRPNGANQFAKREAKRLRRRLEKAGHEPTRTKDLIKGYQ